MASRPRQQQELSKDTVPTDFPVGTPRMGHSGHDFTLQAVMEMQRSIGDLAAKTDRLITDVKSQGDKIDGIRTTIAWFTGAAAAVGLIGGMFISFLIKAFSSGATPTAP